MYPTSLEDPRWRRALAKAMEAGGAELARPAGPDRWEIDGARGFYIVNWVAGRPTCTCDAGSRDQPCYHAAAVLLGLPALWCGECGSVRVLGVGDACGACAARAAEREADAAAAVAALLAALSPSPEARERILKAALAVSPDVQKSWSRSLARSA